MNFVTISIDSLYVSGENKWNNMHVCVCVCVCVYREDISVHTVTEYIIWSLCFPYVFQEKGNTLFTQKQGEVFSLNLVLKYLRLSYLHTKRQTGLL